MYLSGIKTLIELNTILCNAFLKKSCKVVPNSEFVGEITISFKVLNKTKWALSPQIRTNPDLSHRKKALKTRTDGTAMFPSRTFSIVTSREWVCLRSSMIMLNGMCGNIA